MVAAACWIFSFVVCLTTVYTIFFTHIFDLFLTPFEASHPDALLLKTIAFIFFTVPAATSTSFSSGFIIIFSVMLGKLCDFLTKKFEEKLSKDGTYRGKLEKFRQQHNDLCILIQSVDNFMSVYIAETLVLIIGLTCTVLYGLIYFSETRETPLKLLATLWYLFCCFCYLASVCLASSYVNTKAHELYDELHGLNLHEETTDHIAQVCCKELKSFICVRLLSKSSINLFEI